MTRHRITSVPRKIIPMPAQRPLTHLEIIIDNLSVAMWKAEQAQWYHMALSGSLDVLKNSLLTLGNMDGFVVQDPWRAMLDQTCPQDGMKQCGTRDCPVTDGAYDRYAFHQFA